MKLEELVLLWICNHNESTGLQVPPILKLQEKQLLV